jgi:hypothetical protein
MQLVVDSLYLCGSFCLVIGSLIHWVNSYLS